jgi:4-diphosphocytidyl-2-C-methyl-D-erythritol kinase
MIRELAPAKVNLVLHVGPRRENGLHELCSIFASLELADEVTVEAGATSEDEVVCPGVEGPNLAARAAAALREEAAPELPPLRIGIDKRIPVAAGLGGGSADAAAVLRAANELADRPLDAAGLTRLGATLGSDVPSQLAPGHAIVSGAGEGVEPVALPGAWVVLVPQAEGLSTGAVYEEADRIGSTRESLDPAALRELAASPLPELAAVLDNDLEPATFSLRPDVAGIADALRRAGALGARVAGSGPTVFGLFDDPVRAREAAALWSDAIVTRFRQI